MAQDFTEWLSAVANAGFGEDIAALDELRQAVAASEPGSFREAKLALIDAMMELVDRLQGT